MGLRILVLLVLSFNAFANYEVYFTDSKSINFARSKFYQAVRENLDDTYNMNGTIDRSLLVQAHPPAEKDFQTTEVKIPKEISQMIRPIQRDLEVKAGTKALIVDCKPKTSQFVTNCGLYRYSRPKQKIDASAVRYFSVEIDEPQKWAGPIVQNFMQQTEKEVERKEAKLMQEYIESISEQKLAEKNEKAMVSFGVKQRSLDGFNIDGPYAEYAKGSDDFYSLLGFGSYQSPDDIQINGLEFGARNISAQVNKLRWEMTYRAHLDQLSIQGDDETLFGLSLGLGVNASLNETTLLHLSYGVRRSTKIENADSELAKNFNEDLLSLNISRVF